MIEGYKKKGLSHDNHNLNVNLKSNTMKNTVQRYGLFFNLPNLSKKKIIAL
jgi:hypothetical protein